MAVGCQGDKFGVEKMVMGCQGDVVGVADWPVCYMLIVGWMGCMLAELEALACRVRVTIVSWVYWGDGVGDEEGL